MAINPEVLIISNKFDFATDLITNRLREFGASYLRLNRDELGDYHIELNPLLPSLIVEVDGYKYEFDKTTLRSIYYRAPTFLRDIFQNDINEEEQLFRTQWSAFVRALIVFDGVRWINNPVDTYRAEMKPYQLFLANKIGFKVPNTKVSNSTTINDQNQDIVAIKSIDTAIISKGDEEAFIYTTLINGQDIVPAKYSSPFFIQTGLIPKIDIRVTIIDNTVIPIRIKATENIDTDWRTYKGELVYEIFELPKYLTDKCLEFANNLKLSFCAIDMVEYLGEYYFIEVNPTGEWAWLQKNTEYEFDKAIAQALLQ